MATQNINTTDSVKKGKVLSDEEIIKQEKQLAEMFKSAPKKTLFLPEGLGIQNPLPIGINGVQIVVPVGVEVEVPEPFYNLIMAQSNILNKKYGQTLRDGKPLEDLVKVKNNP